MTVHEVTSSGSQISGIVLQAFDGIGRYLAIITPTGIELASPSGPVSVPFDVLGTHTYRLESPANSTEMSLFIDGQLKQSVNGLNTSLNGFDFGDGLTPAGNAGSCDWDYVRVFQGILLTLSVDIDIKPGSLPNSINLKSKGVIPVAILTTDDFDATMVDPLSVLFGPNGATESHGKGHIEDADSDGDLDLVLHFKIQETGIPCGDTSASLTGITTGGQTFEGSDSIKTVGCK